MTTDYMIQLTRYKDGERRQSSEIHITAHNFQHAVQRASDLLEGNQLADPKGDFEIASIRCEKLGGPICDHGWLTSDEVS